MKKVIRDLFTEDEWDTLTEEFLPQLSQIADLPLIHKEEEDDPE